MTTGQNVAYLSPATQRTNSGHGAAALTAVQKLENYPGALPLPKARDLGRHKVLAFRSRSWNRNLFKSNDWTKMSRPDKPRIRVG